MKFHLLPLLLLFCALSLPAQEPVPNETSGKGITPISSPSADGGGQEGATYAVVVGISDYQDDNITDLRFADKDAEAFAAFLQSPAGGSLDEDHLKVLTNENATAAQFAIALDWLWEVAKEDDQVIIFFSGHGDVERKSITQPGYLLCWDAPARVYMAGGAFNVRDLNDVVSTLSIQNKAKVILVTDACRAGKLSGSGVNGAQATAANLAKQYANEIKILSCQPDEYSIEGEQWDGGRGAFSYHLLDGLAGMADSDADNAVNLKEIGRYLEDYVTAEVAPQKQNPMVVGNKTEKLTDVLPEILAQLKEGRRGQLQLFTSTESRGIEDEVLAAADSNIVEMYLAFKESLAEKNFLCDSSGLCADVFYEKLQQEPQLEKLHSTMRRNYAAALQDEAQQVLNIMLKTGLTDQILKAADVMETYGNYPDYLERAGELLGEQHYMYTPLQARKHFFEGILLRKRDEKRAAFHKALDHQPDMPHAMVYLLRTFKAEEADSAELYAQKAMTIIPSWVEPYIAMSGFYLFNVKRPEKAEEMLRLAGEVDSTSVLVWYKKAQFYRVRRNYKEAEKWYLKIIEGTGQDICFPCAYLDLGYVYQNQGRYDEALPYILKSLEVDSVQSENYTSFCRPCAYVNLAFISMHTDDQVGRKQNLLKALEADSTFAMAYYNLGAFYSDNDQVDLAEEMYQKCLHYNSNFSPAWVNLGSIYYKSGRLEEAESAYQKGLETPVAWAYPYAHSSFGILLMNTGRLEKARHHFEKALELNPNLVTPIINLGRLFLKTHAVDEAKPLIERAFELEPDNPDVLIGLALLKLHEDQPEQAWQYFEQGLSKGYDKIDDLRSKPDFEELRKDPKWDALMKKYFPDQFKD